MANLSLAQMLALLPDNSTGLIDAVDLRDIVTAIFERTDGTNPIPGLLFDTAGAVSGAIGHVHWDTNNSTLAVEVATDGTLQVGHEQYVRAKNTTGATILNGRPVRITGGQGSEALVSLDNGLGTVVGVATEDIANNAIGRVTTFGVVNDIDTSAFADGNTLYASATGTLTTSVTSSRVGTVLNASPTAGRLLVIARELTRSSGTTANRPATVSTGFWYYDTTLGQPIVWSGTAWEDAMGTPV